MTQKGYLNIKNYGACLGTHLKLVGSSQEQWPGEGGVGEGGRDNHSRVVNERRISEFSLTLESWDFRKVRALSMGDNVARFRNELRDMYNRLPRNSTL